MAEYLIKEESLTTIGDRVRTLSGLQNGMSPSAMADNIDAANNEIDGHSSLIAQIISALNGKAAGGSSSGIEMCRVTIQSTATPNKVVYITDLNGTYKTWLPEEPGSVPEPFDCVKGSLLYVSGGFSSSGLVGGINIGSGVVLATADFMTIS